MKTVSRLALSSAVLLALAACGNKGPLVLPERPTPVQPPASSTPPDNDGAPPVQVKPQDTTTAPTSEDNAADKAVDEGGADGDG